MMKCPEEKGLCVCCLAAAVGLVWGLSALGMGVVTIYTETYAHKMVEVLGSIYPGYEPGSWAGAFIGLAWAFGDGFIGTWIIVGVYRLFSGCCRRFGICRPKGEAEQAPVEM